MNETYNQPAETNEFPDSNTCQPYQYPDPPAEKKSDEASSYGIASLVLGIVSFFIMPTLVTSILAIIFGRLSRKRTGKSKVATAGTVCGIISLVISIALWVFFIIIMAMMGDMIQEMAGMP